MTSLLSPSDWPEYELIDSGSGEKLERFGAYTLCRPEPQAVWSPALPAAEWARLQHARFAQEGSHAGAWIRSKPMQDQWFIGYERPQFRFRMRLGMTAFKHVGVFPEQAPNWDFIYAQCRRIPQARVLNLFAYTGGASLAARAAGADVTHCDSVRAVLNWAAANMQASGFEGIHWLLEDALKFVQREARRGRTYQGIVLDPPAYGHGPKGEKWKLEDMADELTRETARLLDPQGPSFLVFNSYSLGFSPLVLRNLVQSHFPASLAAQAESGELFLPERSGRRLPAGIFCRFASMP
ncbi:MAG: class I SAM-dependent methyltransferase [Bacteroidia bacterium]|nr:class I SAM-dependent methyltransferase [Bacteroidia bacterium]